MIKNIVNDKIYIGQSIDIATRWIQHKSEFKRGTHHNKYFQNSWNKYKKDKFIFKVVEECLKEELDVKEKYWINYYQSYNSKYGYNLSDGGEACHNITKENKELIRQGKKNNKPIYQINFKGTIIKKWKFGVSEASKKLGIDSHSILRCCKKQARTYKNFIWIYVSEYDDSFDLDNYINLSTQPKKIVQLDKNYRILKIWNNAYEIEKELNYFASNICRVCRNKKGISHGFRWLYLKDYKVQEN